MQINTCACDMCNMCMHIYAHRGLLREASACEVHDGGNETVTKQRDALALADLRLGEIGARWGEVVRDGMR